MEDVFEYAQGDVRNHGQTEQFRGALMWLTAIVAAAHL